MKLLLLPCALLGAFFALAGSTAEKPTAPDQATAVRELMTWLLEDETRLREIPFPVVMEAASGHKVLPLDSTETCRALLAHIKSKAASVLTAMNAADSPVRGLRRINEASRHFEDALVKALDSGDFSCVFPQTAAGEAQRSGYPDLCLTHKPSGKICYLDPKLFEATSRASTLRTFYFEPKRRTNKVTKDAHHLLLGFAHDGEDGEWKFLTFDVVDLSQLKVELKAEFHASNAEVYRAEAIKAQGP